MVAGIYGSLAQLVEHWTFNPGVSGSNPEWLTSRRPAQGGFLLHKEDEHAYPLLKKYT